MLREIQNVNSVYFDSACSNGNLEEIKKYVAEGIDINGGDGRYWISEGENDDLVDGPLGLPLGGAARCGQLEACKLLLELGADLNAVNCHNENALFDAVEMGKMDIALYLIEQGATWDAITSKGTIINCAYNRAIREDDEMLTFFLEKTSSNDKTIEILKESCKDIQYFSNAAKKKVPVLFKKIEEAWNIEGTFDSIIEQIEASKKANTQKKKAKKESLKSYVTKEAVAKTSWEKSIKKLIGKKIQSKRPFSLKDIGAVILSSPNAIEHDAWPSLMRQLLNLTVTYADYTEEIYGERLTLSDMDDDEGGALEMYADEHLYTIDTMLKILSQKEVISHADWATLVRETATYKAEALGYMSFGDEEAEKLCKKAWVQEHPEFPVLHTEIKRAFPYANMS